MQGPYEAAKLNFDPEIAVSVLLREAIQYPYDSDNETDPLLSTTGELVEAVTAVEDDGEASRYIMNYDNTKTRVLVTANNAETVVSELERLVGQEYLEYFHPELYGIDDSPPINYDVPRLT